MSDQDIIRRLRDAAASLAEEFERDEGPMPDVKSYWTAFRAPRCSVGHVMYRAGVKNFFDIPGYLRSAFGKVEYANDNTVGYRRRKEVAPVLRKLVTTLSKHLKENNEP